MVKSFNLGKVNLLEVLLVLPLLSCCDGLLLLGVEEGAYLGLVAATSLFIFNNRGSYVAEDCLVFIGMIKALYCRVALSALKALLALVPPTDSKPGLTLGP